MGDNRNLPEFDRPPVVEVVCGIQFKSLDSMFAAHLGLLWEKFKQEFPNCREVAPLAPVIEGFGKSPPMQIAVTQALLLPRTWFLKKDETELIQIQRERFHYNWKKVQKDDSYPRYNKVRQKFEKVIATFDEFLNENDIGTITPLQYELTYVNHILRGEGWDSLAEIGKIMPDFGWRGKRERFLPEFESINWGTSFVLPKQQGRFRVLVREALRKSDESPLLNLELTARGMAKDNSRNAMWEWFDLAHEWIVFGFADLTSEEIQKHIWRRTR